MLLPGLALLLLPAGCGRLEEPPPSAPLPAEEAVLLRIQPHRADAATLGFGWSKPERGRRAFRWIEHLEADLHFDWSGPQDAQLHLTAAPYWLNWKRQRIALYLNGQFIAEWLCPDGPDFHTYQTPLPAAALREGPNVLTLRAGYKVRQGREPRELSLAVAEVLLAHR